MPLLKHSANSSLHVLPRQLGAWIVRQSAALHPESFALVMATGIVSNALFVEAYHKLSGLLFYGNVLAYIWLAAFTAVRSVYFPQAVWSDLTDPRRVFSFFTLVASNGVVGVGIHLRGVAAMPLNLWLLALFTWFVLIYFSFGLLSFRNTAQGANVLEGGWLLAVVGTESLVILGAFIAPSAGELSSAVFVLIHMLWSIGLGLYAIIVTLLAYRIFFSDIGPDDMTPLLWVIMGAAAITTNAGSTLILIDSGMASLRIMRPFIDGVTFVVWAWATWWIPLLMIFGIWKHGVCHVPLVYAPVLWAIVFPLGMYSLASLRLSLADDLPLLRVISLPMLWISVAAWIATFLGLIVSSWRSFHEFRLSENRGSSRNPQQSNSN